MPNKVYTAPEASTTWTDSGGDKTMDLTSLAADGLVIGAYLDRGSGSRATKYHYNFIVGGFSTAPIVGESVLLFFSQSDDGTNFDGQPTTAPGAATEGSITENQANNCLYVDTAIVHSTTAADKLQISGEVILTGRYISPVVHNKTADALSSTSASHSVELTPIPDELQ